jgi:hypothetical protein
MKPDENYPHRLNQEIAVYKADDSLSSRMLEKKEVTLSYSSLTPCTCSWTRIQPDRHREGVDRRVT